MSETATTKALAALHTALVDARHGYEAALADDRGEGLAPVFQAIIDLRRRHEDALKRELQARGTQPDESGSFMSLVHKTVIGVRSAIAGLGPSAVGGFIDGEQRIVSHYEDAIDAADTDALRVVLRDQRAEVDDAVAQMQQFKAAASA